MPVGITGSLCIQWPTVSAKGSKRAIEQQLGRFVFGTRDAHTHAKVRVTMTSLELGKHLQYFLRTYRLRVITMLLAARYNTFS